MYDKHFLEKTAIFLFQTPWNLISYLIHLKSQHTVLRAICGLSGAVFGFALTVIAFEILSFFFCKKCYVFGNMGFSMETPRIKTVLMSK